MDSNTYICMYIFYFAGEKRELVFSPGELRHSKEWFDGQWHNMKKRPDIVSSFSGTEKKSDVNEDGASFDNKRDFVIPINDDALPRIMIKIGNSRVDSDDKMPNESIVVPDLSKDHSLANLRWKSSGKRRRGRSPVHKLHSGTSGSCLEVGFQTFENIFADSSLKFESDNCKYASDAHFSSSAVSSLTNLVMSR